MTEEQLRRWAAGELDDRQELEVYRWMVTCTSPDLSPLLQGFLREQREAEADRRLSAVGDVWSAVVAGWSRLLEAGSAAWIDPGAPLVLASAEATAGRPWASLEWVDEDTAELELRVEASGVDVAAYVTTDTPSVVRLQAWRGEDSRRVALPPGLGARPTVWVVRGAVLPRHSDVLEEWRACVHGDLEVLAIRWTDRA